MKNKLMILALSTLFVTTSLTSCGSKVDLSKKAPDYQNQNHTNNYIDDIYRNYYQVLVYSYYDSNGDKIGDINGLTQKLDYINDGDKNSKTSLGYDGIYLLPIFPSPTYHKYDTTDYYSIDSDYGTMEDFENFMSECNKRGIDVILDLAINHTSNLHPWFLKGKTTLSKLTSYDSETGEPTMSDKALYAEIRYYHFVHKDMISLYRGTQFFSIAGTEWMYEGSFNSGMPDLNLADIEVQKEIKNIMKFWLDKGVSGFRLDAVQHYFDWDKKQNYDFLNLLYMYGEALTYNRDKTCYFVAEGPWSDTSTTYNEFTDGISYMNFNFGSGGANKLANVINYSSIYNDKLDELKDDEIKYDDNLDVAGKRCAADYFKNIVQNWDNKLYGANENAIDANFGVNHDTLRAINNFSAKFSNKNDELQNACKFYWGLNNTLSGVTFNYYGEEIGMRAGNPSIEQNKDPDKRHPMYWSNTNTNGMTDYAPGGSPVEQYLDPADKQMKDSDSLWNFIRELNRAKAFFPEIARGKQAFIKVAPTYAIMEKSYNDNKIYLLYNFSDKASKIMLSDIGLEEEITEIKYSLSSSSSYYSKLTAESINVPAYSITIF